MNTLFNLLLYADEHPSVDDFVVCIVRSEKGTEKKFIAQVMSTHESPRCYDVRFFKPTKQRKQFYLSDEPFSTVAENDIVSLLEKPKAGSTTRTKNIVTFTYDVELENLM